MPNRQKAVVDEGRTSKHPLSGKALFSDTELQEEWRQELRKQGIETRRTPRPGRARLYKLLRDSWPPHIFLREHARTTDIILRFPVSSRILPPRYQKSYRGLGIGLEDVFAKAVRTAPAKKQDTFWSQLAELGFDAYHRTWMHLLWLLYRDQFDPKVDEKLAIWLRRFETLTKRRREKGRPSRKKVQGRELRKVYSVRLRECEQLHRAVENAVREEKKKGTRAIDVPGRIRRRLWKRVYQMRGGHLILGGEAFPDTGSGAYDTPPLLEVPMSWTPEQLAIGLVAFDVGSKYDTVRKNLGLSRKKAKQKSKRNTRSR